MAHRKPDRVGPESRKRLARLDRRIDQLEASALGQLRRALGAGQQRLLALDEALERVSRDGWASGRRLREALEAAGARARRARAAARERLDALPRAAITALAGGTRVPVQTLAGELRRLARAVEPRRAPRRGVAGDGAATRTP